MNDFRSVLILSEEGHFGRAAERLRITQSTLSVRLKRIEQIVEAKLFERGRSGVSPTPAGVAFVEGAQRVLGTAEEVRQSTTNAAQGFGETLRIGFTQVAAYQLLERTLASFLEAQPKARIRLYEGVTAALERRLEAREIDVAFIHPPLHSSSLAERTITRSPLVHVSARGEPEAPIIRFPRSDAPVLMGRLSRGEDAEGRASRAEADTMTGAIVASLAGYGACVLPADFPHPLVERAGRRVGVLETCIAWHVNDDRAIVRALLDCTVWLRSEVD